VKFIRRFTAVITLLIVFLGVTLVNAQAPLTPDQICTEAAPAAEPATREYANAEQVLASGIDYRAIFCTSAGAVYIDLFEEYAPITVNNFVFLATEGYYNNTTFHRVIADFMAQAGDPTATGSGGPGYSFEDEFIGFLNFDKPGWLAMANAGPATNGSQFFITTAVTDHLNFQHTVFGEVLQGLENVGAIPLRDPASATEPGAALNTVVIITDPSTVETTYAGREAATPESFQSVIDAVAGSLPAAMSVNADETGVFLTADAIARLPETQREAATTVFEANQHEFRVNHSVINSACDLEQIPYMSIGYVLDVYATADDAAAALADGWYAQQYVDAGFVASPIEGTDQPLLSLATTACEAPANSIVTFTQRGRFVAITSAVVPADHAIEPIRWLRELVALSTYEFIFSEQLRSILP